jgi:monoamine oxidase
VDTVWQWKIQQASMLKAPGSMALLHYKINKRPPPVAKSKEVAIVGTGIAGLMVWLNLNMVGLKNVTIIEAAQRLGGRVHTAYLGPSKGRQYQEVYSTYSEIKLQIVLTSCAFEMGAMRFPRGITYADTRETLEIQV